MLEKIRHITSEKLLHGFRLRKSFEVPDFRLHVVQLEHEKTHANFLHLARDDTNKTFRQEGWRLEPNDLDKSSSDLHVKGIVYNEMKGVFSNSFNRFAYTVQNNLLPKTYGYISGGYPDNILDLSWNDLKEFHANCYHPSNSVFYTYGNVELEKCLEYIDTEYLQHYEPITPTEPVNLEPEWNKARAIEVLCEPDPMAPDPDRQCSVALGYRLDDVRNIYTNFVLGLMSNLLIDGDNAPFYRGLIESGYGLDWISSSNGMERESRTTSFHIAVQGVANENVGKFNDEVQSILAKVVCDGFPKDRIDAMLHQYELMLRNESARFGLNLIMSLSNAVNHGVDLEEVLNISKLIKRFRDDLEKNPKLLEEIVEKYLLNNSHRLTAAMRPDKEWQSLEAQKQVEILTKLTANVNPSDREELAANAKKLNEKQQKEDDISCLPCLDLLDICLETQLEPFTLTQTTDHCPVQLNEAFTNDLVYFHALADLEHLPADLLPYVPLFCELFTRLGADNLSYLEMAQAIELHTGGLNASEWVTPKLGQHAPNVEAFRAVHLSGFCLDSKITNFFDLWSKLFNQPDWTNFERLMTLILMSATGEWSANALSHSAHSFAMRRAASNLSPTCSVKELWSGLEQAKLMKRMGIALCSNDTQAVEESMNQLVDKMKSIWQFVVSKKRLRFSLHGESEGLNKGLASLETFTSALPSPDGDASSSPLLWSNLSPKTYFVMPYNVHYVAQAIEAPMFDEEMFASYRVLAHLMTSKYLHREIREKGGAYGGGAVASAGVLHFYSYRDPHARLTLDAFENVVKWASQSDFEDQDINEAKLAVFQEIDKPISPGDRGLKHFMGGITDEMRQTHRTQLFSVKASDLRETANQIIAKLSSSGDLTNQIGQVVLGPETSSDWPGSVKAESNFDQSKWNRVHLD